MYCLFNILSKSRDCLLKHLSEKTRWYHHKILNVVEVDYCFQIKLLISNASKDLMFIGPCIIVIVEE